MSKIRKSFRLDYPLKQKVVRDLKLVTTQVGILVVEGYGYFDPAASPLDIYERYSVDIDTVSWNGTDIRPVLEVTGFMDDLIEASVRFVASTFHQETRKAA
jgi:hypothetical protein